MQTVTDLNRISVDQMPAVPGLVFRGFRGAEDYPKMVAVINGAKDADGIEWATSAEDTARDYQHLTNCDPATDMIFAQVADQVVGYGRCWWYQQIDGTRLYCFFAHLLPQWRDKGIRRAMLNWLHARLRQIAVTHPQEGPRFLQNWCSDTEHHLIGLLESAGFEVVRYGLEMKRPLTGELPFYTLPQELEIRRGTHEEWRRIWEAARESFRDHWGASEWTEDRFTEWQKEPTFNPRLWQIAWHGSEVAGGVLNFIDVKENEEYERLRGYTETIFVRRPWRQQGVAKALISASFQVLKAEGMTEAALGVDADNLSGALHLYRKMGFRKEKQHMTYRKPL